ncbi:hypothetical protein YPPY61_0239, partial [Yersinia pestis PY-61]
MNISLLHLSHVDVITPNAHEKTRRLAGV